MFNQKKLFKPKREKIDYDKLNRERIAKMKYGAKKGFFNIVVKEEAEVGEYEHALQSNFEDFETGYLQSLQLPEYFAQQIVEVNEAEIEQTENVRMLDMTKLKEIGPVTLYKNYVKFSFEFDSDKYSERAEIQRFGQIVYNNALRLFYVSVEAYNAFSPKEKVYENSIGEDLSFCYMTG